MTTQHPDAWRFLYRARYLTDDDHDGDTLPMRLDWGMGAHVQVQLRIAGLWCPELNEPGGPEAADYATAWLVERQQASSLDWPFMVEVHKRPRSGAMVRSFTRYVADVYDEHLGSFAAAMLSEGHGTADR